VGRFSQAHALAIHLAAEHHRDSCSPAIFERYCNESASPGLLFLHSRRTFSCAFALGSGTSTMALSETDSSTLAVRGPSTLSLAPNPISLSNRYRPRASCAFRQDALNAGSCSRRAPSSLRCSHSKASCPRTRIGSASRRGSGSRRSAWERSTVTFRRGLRGPAGSSPPRPRPRHPASGRSGAPGHRRPGAASSALTALGAVDLQGTFQILNMSSRILRTRSYRR